MNTNKLHVVTALALLAFAVSALAQSMTKDEYKAKKESIEAQYNAGKMQCESLAGNAKDICAAEAKGKDSIAKAELNAKFNNTPKTRYELSLAKADANYAVAKERCDDMSGDAKDLCSKEAKATHAAAKANAKEQSNK